MFYLRNPAVSVSAVTSVRPVSKKKKKNSHGTSHCIRRGSFYYQGPFEIYSILWGLRRMFHYIYHTRFPDVMAAAACLWWGVWYQMAGLIMPLAACFEGSVRSFYDRNLHVKLFWRWAHSSSLLWVEILKNISRAFQNLTHASLTFMPAIKPAMKWSLINNQEEVTKETTC